MQNRSESFAPHFASNHESPIAYARIFNGPAPLTVFAIQPAESTSEPPPGLTDWPAPNEAWVSPAVAVDFPLGTLSPYGKVAGIIDARKLSSLDEHWVYFNPLHVNLSLMAKKYPDTTLAVDRFGGTDGSFALFYSESRVVFISLLAAFIVLPTIAFAWAAVGINLLGRRAAVATYTVLGATARFRLVMLWGENCASIAAGTLMSSAIVALISLTDVRIPLTGSTLLAIDSQQALPASLCSIGLAGLTLFGLGVARAWRPTRSGHGGLLNSDRAVSLYAWAAPISLLSLSQQWFNLIENVSIRQIVFIVSVLILLTSTPALIWVGTRAVATLAARHASNLHSLVAFRQFTALSGRFVTSCLALVLGIGLLGTSQIFTTFYGDAVAESRAVGDQVGSSQLITQFSFKENRPDILNISRQAPGIDYIAITSEPPRENSNSAQWSYRLYGTCAGLSAVQIACPAMETSVPTQTISNPGLKYFVGSDFLNVRIATPKEIFSVNDEDNQFLLVSTSRRNINLLHVQASASQFMAEVKTISAAWTNDLNAQHMKWLTLFAPFTMIMLSLTLCLNSWSTILERLEAITHFTLMWSNPKLIWSLSTAVLLAPLLIGLNVGILMYAYLGQMFGASYTGMHADPLSIVLVAISTLITLVVFWTISTIVLVRRTTLHPLGVLA